MTVDPLETIFRADAQLDDVTRARIWTALAPRIAAPPQRRRWPWIACAGVAVAAAAAFAVVALGRRAPAGVEHEVPPGGALALTLGPTTRAVVDGPGRIVVEREGTETAVELRSGTLYGEFTGGGGRSLRIDAAGSTIEIVGTLFAVSVDGDAACLSVAHGRVRMTSAAVAVEVEGGQRVCAARGAPPGPVGAVDAATGKALARHEHTWLADAAEAGAAGPADAPPAVAVAAGTSAPAPIVDPAAAPTVVRTAKPEPARAAAAPPRGASDKPASPAPASAPASADEDLYRAADEAIARGDPAAAERALTELIASTPQSPLADEARYERARLAFDRRDWTAVRALVATVQTRSPLREPAVYLGCRAALEIDVDEARACLSVYVAAFPDAPHATDALSQLVDLAYRTGGCAAIARPLADLGAIAPGAPVLAAWHRRCGTR